METKTESSCTLLPEPNSAASIYLNMAIEKRLLQGKALLSNIPTQYRNQVLKHDQMCWHAVLLYHTPSALQHLQRVIPEQAILMLRWHAVHVRRLEALHTASRGVETPGSFSPACTHADNNQQKHAIIHQMQCIVLESACLLLVQLYPDDAS